MSDELATQGEKALVDPRTNKPRGYDNFTQEDLILPRIAIGQAMSKAVQDGELRPGELYNTLTKETYSRDNQPYLEFLVVQFTKSRRLWDKDNKDNSLCMSLDGRISQSGNVCQTQCPHLRIDVAKDPGIDPEKNAFDWSEDNKGNRLSPACTLYNNYLSILPPFDSSNFPCSVSMGRTSAKAAKQFNSFIMATNEDIFARIYALTSEKKENKKGSFFVYKVKQVRRVARAEYENAEAMAARLATTSYTIHDEDDGEKGTGSDEPYRDQF